MKRILLGKQWLNKAIVFLQNPPLFYKIGIFVILVGCLLPIRVTITQSVEPRLFLLVKPDVIKHGDFVLFKRKDTKYVHFPYIKETIKQVAGIAGDEVSVKNHEYFVNKKTIGFAKTKTKKGEILPGTKPGTIPRGFLFLYGTHPDSFDSRYAAMGLVEESRIRYRAIPIF